MKTAFLLGAGASKDAGLPLADDLTGKVLNDESGILQRWDNPPYQPGGLKSTSQGMAQSILPFLRWIKVQVECADTSDNHVANYEDLAYMAAQIRDHLLGEYDNPTVHPLIQKALCEVWPLLPGKLQPRCELKRIAEETAKYITHATCCAVHGVGCNLDYLRFLIEVPPQCNEGALNIFSLNNDTLVEQFLLMKRKPFIDGFSPALPAEEGQWEPSLFEESAAAETIRLFKLHGSINWFRWRRPPKSRRDKFIRTDPENGSGGQKRRTDCRSTPEGSPEILVGVFNKMLHYLSALYLPLHYHFYRELETTDALIVYGYSFGDKGINQRIVDWMEGKVNRKMVVVGPHAKERGKKARPAIGMTWEQWRKSGKLVPCSYKVGYLNWRVVWKAL
jgi:hypothetical protein